MITQSLKLKQFYTELQAWIDAGFPEHAHFHPNMGLCSNLNDWIEFNQYDDDIFHALNTELTQQFIAAGLNNVFPFNPISVHGKTTYTIGFKYDNEARLTWVKEHAA